VIFFPLIITPLAFSFEIKTAGERKDRKKKRRGKRRKRERIVGREKKVYISYFKFKTHFF
jgi:hypothetical protein